MSQQHHSVDPIFGANLVYYNATVVNNTAGPLPAVVNDTRAQAIIHVPERWELSIVRFDVDTSLIPVSKLPMRPESTELTDLSITFVDENTSQIVGPTYGVSFTLGLETSMQAVVDCINSAFRDYSSLSGTKPSDAPYVWYNAELELLQIFAPSSWVGSPIAIFVNKTMHRYLRGLPFIYYGQPDGRDFRLAIESSWQAAESVRPGFPAAIQQPYASAGLIYKTQEAKTLSSWSAARSIYLTTDSFPVQSESIPNSVLLSNRGSVSSSSIPIVTDFIFPTDGNPAADRDRLEYLPTAEYRMIQLGGREPVMRVNLQAWWTDFAGNSYPIQLSEQGSFSAKVLFRKRLTVQA
jgi:hypothetical protein